VIQMAVGCLVQNVHIVHCMTAARLQMSVDDVDFLLGKARENQEEQKNTNRDDAISHSLSVSSIGSATADNLAEAVVTGIQMDFARCQSIWQLPKVALYIFANRCTPVAVLQYSLFISSSMSAMLFTCDMATASALAVFFFQASGGALAKNADPQCESSNSVYEQLGRLLAIGSLTVVVGIMPSLVLSQLHQRDFIVCQGDDQSWEAQLRLWQVQDRIIYFSGFAFIGFCFFYDLVFIANVTPEDGDAWCVSCIISMAQTLFVVPAVMTVITLFVVLLSRLSGRIHDETKLLCLVGRQCRPSKAQLLSPTSPFTLELRCAPPTPAAARSTAGASQQWA